MLGVRSIPAIHNHRPVGHFDDLFVGADRRGSLSIPELKDDPDIPFALLTSGPASGRLVELRSESTRAMR